MLIELDKWDKRLLRFNITAFIVILFSSITYYQIIPYATHDITNTISLIIGGITSIGSQIALHRLMSKRKKRNVKRGDMVE